MSKDQVVEWNSMILYLRTEADKSKEILNYLFEQDDLNKGFMARALTSFVNEMANSSPGEGWMGLRPLLEVIAKQHSNILSRLIENGLSAQAANQLLDSGLVPVSDNRGFHPFESAWKQKTDPGYRFVAGKILGITIANLRDASFADCLFSMDRRGLISVGLARNHANTICLSEISSDREEPILFAALTPYPAPPGGFELSKIIQVSQGFLDLMKGKIQQARTSSTAGTSLGLSGTTTVISSVSRAASESTPYRHSRP